MRTCGDCTLCCRGPLTVKINEHEVYPNHPCPHVDCSGCSIFDDPSRPKVCHQYKCEWLRDSAIPEWMKPNKSNCILTRHEDRIVLSGSIDDYVGASALSFAINYCALHGLRLDYTIRSEYAEDHFDRGSIISAGTQVSSGTMTQIFYPIELFFHHE